MKPDSTTEKTTVFTSPKLKHPVEVESAMYKDPAVLFTAAHLHEVRNPLTNINMAVEALSSMSHGEEEKIYFDIILRSSNRINSLVTDLIIQQLSTTDKIEEFSLHQLLDEALSAIADRITIKQISVIKEYASLDYKAKMDIEKMKIALTNIIINAVYAMQEKTGQLKLITTLIDKQFTLQIKDNGCGISPASLEHIFKPYFTQKVGGLGVGLAATYSILKVNNITLKVESEVNKGTCFFLEFPN
jgi:signal transduction histidine kinase